MLDCACKIREQFAMVIVAKVLHSFRLRGKPLFRNCFSCIGVIMVGQRNASFATFEKTSIYKKCMSIGSAQR